MEERETVAMVGGGGGQNERKSIREARLERATIKVRHVGEDFD